MNAEALGLSPNGDIAVASSVSTHSAGMATPRAGRVSPFALSMGRTAIPGLSLSALSANSLGADGTSSLAVESLPAMPKAATHTGSRGAKLTQGAVGRARPATLRG